MRKTQRDAVAPALRGRRFRCDQAQIRVGDNAYPTLLRHDADPVARLLHIEGLIGLARELGNGTERADAPAGLSVGKPACDQVHERIGRCHEASLTI
nr:hypothetical protein [Bradyrhizobium liaoningense]